MTHATGCPFAAVAAAPRLEQGRLVAGQHDVDDVVRVLPAHRRARRSSGGLGRRRPALEVDDDAPAPHLVARLIGPGARRVVAGDDDGDEAARLQEGQGVFGSRADAAQIVRQPLQRAGY